jgi:hypothetical protein
VNPRHQGTTTSGDVQEITTNWFLRIGFVKSGAGWFEVSCDSVPVICLWELGPCTALEPSPRLADHWNGEVWRGHEKGCKGDFHPGGFCSDAVQHLLTIVCPRFSCHRWAYPAHILILSSSNASKPTVCTQCTPIYRKSFPARR